MVLSSLDYLLRFSFFWKFFFLHSSQDFYKCKETLEEEKLWVCSFYCSLLLGPPVWGHPTTYFLPLCDISGCTHSAKPRLSENHGLGLSRAVPVFQYFTRLSILVLKSFAQEIKRLFFLPLCDKFFLSLLSANFQTQCVLQIFPCRYSPLGLCTGWISWREKCKSFFHACLCSRCL